MKCKSLYLITGAMFIPAMLMAADNKKPNIIYILADDLGYGDLGCYGQKLIETPNINKLAAKGMRFTQHYSGAPVSAPSRCVLLTGKHMGHSYIRGNDEWAERGKFGITGPCSPTRHSKVNAPFLKMKLLSPNF